jgi:hypothetical protein
MPRHSRDNRSRGAVSLGVAVGAIAVIWLVVLPRVGSLGSVREFVRRNETAGINPSAVYYTEVEAMGAIGERLTTGKE